VTGTVPDHIRELLVQSLMAWRVAGEVCREADGTLLLTAGSNQLRIARASGDLPFRWMVTKDERTRGATSVAGLLRLVRAAVDPGHRAVRLSIAPLSFVPP
jgi:hypothetical protein